MTVSSLNFKHKDEDEGGAGYSEILMQQIANGWLVTLTDEDEEEYQYVYEFRSKKELLSLLKELIGVK